MKKLLALKPKPDAVFASNDPAAIGAMKAIWEAGLTVPDDIGSNPQRFYRIVQLD